VVEGVEEVEGTVETVVGVVAAVVGGVVVVEEEPLVSTTYAAAPATTTTITTRTAIATMAIPGLEVCKRWSPIRVII
jgi:hypothetical protein